eukprot:5734554-Prymnesium_polylepis.1
MAGVEVARYLRRNALNPIWPCSRGMASIAGSDGRDGVCDERATCSCGSKATAHHAVIAAMAAVAAAGDAIGASSCSLREPLSLRRRLAPRASRHMRVSEYEPTLGTPTLPDRPAKTGERLVPAYPAINQLGGRWPMLSPEA